MLVKEGEAKAAIVASSRYGKQAILLQEVIRTRTGVTLPILDPQSVSLPLTQALILLGNRSTNRILGRLYDSFFALTDLKYPGAGGYELRTVCDPFGNGYHAIIAGGSDDVGVEAAAQQFVKEISARKDEGGTFSVGWLLEVKLGQKVPLPKEGAGTMPTWQDSMSYGSQGYFGWNSISKNEALYYMTGDPQYAKEFLRLAFPDAKARKDIERIDGERIEKKDDPLAGPYHYNATRMILYWDLIEESPVFTDAERLKVANAFSRQLTHRLKEWTGKNLSDLKQPRTVIGSRHDTYSSLSLYALARYFQRDYPGPVWKQVLKMGGDDSFAPLAQARPWVSGENDNLFWYGTALAPILDYMILSGDRRGVQSGALQYLLKNQEVLWDGTSADRQLSYAALDFLNKASYLLNDGRWLTYRDRIRLETNGFRLDQSFWPDESLESTQPDDLLNRWTIWFLAPAQAASRRSGFPPERSFENMSYRTTTDGGGDFILLDGMNGESRNPYHTFALLNLRIDGKTLLKGYLNQVRTSADGTVTPEVAKDAALGGYFSMGSSVWAEADVPGMPYCEWRRGWYLRSGKYALAADRLKFQKMSERFCAEFWWQNEGTGWTQDEAILASRESRVVPCDSLYTEISATDKRAAVQFWNGAVEANEEKHFFSLIAKADPGMKVRGERLAPNAAIFMAPEPVLVSAGRYHDVDAALSLLSETYGFARALRSAPGIRVSAPVDLDWNFESGILNVLCTEEVVLQLAAAGTKNLIVDGKGVQVKDHTVSLSLAPGNHLLSGVFPASEWISAVQKAASRMSKNPNPAPRKPDSDVPTQLPSLSPTFHVDLPGRVTKIVPGRLNNAPVAFAARGKVVSAVDGAGKILREFESPADISQLHWWDQANRLIIGTSDQRVLAFSPEGTLCWTFQSEMAPEVAAAGKTYWFNTAPGHGGIHGLDSGVFLENRSQLFVGSACTLEILDANGKLMRRLPQFWGPPALFQTVPAADGSVNLLVARDITDSPALHIINSKTMDPSPSGFNGVPFGHRSVGGWIDQRRLHLFHRDVNGDGKKEIISDITGVWNRISTWDEEGSPLASIHFGPGPSPFRGMNELAPGLIRGTDMGDLNGDGRPEIVSAQSNRMVIALDGECRVQWSRRVDGVPTALRMAGDRVVVGQEDGAILVLDGKGVFLSKTIASGAVDALIAGEHRDVLVVRGASIEKFRIP